MPLVPGEGCHGHGAHPARLIEVGRDVLRGPDCPQFVVSPGTYDQKHIDRIGRLKNCIAYGPGILDLAHQPDEWVGVQDMLDSAKVRTLSLRTLLLDPERA